VTAGTQTGTYLDRILENTAAELARRQAARSLEDVERAARGMPQPVPFASSLRGTEVAVIAEVKRASPSKGPIAPGVGAVEVARDYIAGGAAAISVLTDERFFHGSLDDLRSVASLAHGGAPPVPVLRKDFVLDAYQIAEARAAGADAILLIVAALDDARLAELLQAATGWGLAALIEVHDEAELERALRVGARVVGINNRDLRSFAVDLATTECVARLAPPDVTIVGESGIRTRADVERLGRAGVHAVLVGESLMRAPDRAAAVRELRG
jgi:indole-3-glycerol phosphate synthase